MSEDELSISEQVAMKLESMRADIEAAFTRGYATGRRDQVAEDRYYIDRVAQLSELLAKAEAEIARMRARLQQ